MLPQALPEGGFIGGVSPSHSWPKAIHIKNDVVVSVVGAVSEYKGVCDAIIVP